MTSPVDFSASLASIGDAQSAQAQSALQVKTKAKASSEQFEAVFLNSMFQQMFTGIDGDGPFGGSGSLKIWRSFMTDQYAKTFAKAGGIGIASHVYDELLKHQGLTAS
ncbi:MAG: rod-binding protein [Xanthobacteraceae bacterium]|jgi:peptidoglycan hydrolase FlgJ